MSKSIKRVGKSAFKKKFAKVKKLERKGQKAIIKGAKKGGAFAKKHKLGQKALKYGPGAIKAGLTVGGLAASIATGEPGPLAITGVAGELVDQGAAALRRHFSERGVPAAPSSNATAAMPTGAQTGPPRSVAAPYVPEGPEGFPRLKKRPISRSEYKKGRRYAGKQISYRGHQGYA